MDDTLTTESRIVVGRGSDEVARRIALSNALRHVADNIRDGRSPVAAIITATFYRDEDVDSPAWVATVTIGQDTDSARNLGEQIDALQTINADMGRRIADYITAIRVLTELAGHKWL